LLGREEELSGVVKALEVSRLVTLTGAPGIGKTQLALAVADAHRGPVAVVELAPIGDSALVPAALAVALSVQETPGQSLTDTVLTTLRRRRLLLVLDNCEHLLAACRDLVERLLAGCAEVRVLATSREALGLDGEYAWQVPPLPVPAQANGGDPEALMAYPAVELFVNRAGEVQPGFALNGFLASDVADICRRLDGIPLAIELAAARVGTHTPGEIAGRLEDRLSLLSTDGPNPLGRHQTLAAALDWSHALLDARERVLLRRLSVFVGRFELEAAEAICAGGEVGRIGISELLVRLVSKSLLVTDMGSGGQVRYRLLETIRAYATEKLKQAGEAPRLRTAHARFYVTFAEQAEPQLTGPCQEAWLERLEAERANLRASLEWSLCQGQTKSALRLAGALVLFWRVRCHFSDGLDLLEASLSVSRGETSAARAKALWGAGFLRLMAGDPTKAILVLEQSLSCFRKLGDRQGCARALLVLANARQFYNDPSVPELLEQSARLAREAGDHWCLAHALAVAGFESTKHDLRRARQMLEECLAVAREAGDRQSLRIGLLGLGQVAAGQGVYREAQCLLEEAVEVARSLGEGFSHATALGYLAALALGRGHYGRARALLDEALALLPEPAPPEARLELLLLLAWVALAQGERDRARRLLEEVRARGHGVSLLRALGQLAIEDGNPGEGRRLFEEARKLAQADGRKRELAKALDGLGQLARGEGDPERAAALHDEALELHRQVGELPGIADSLEAMAGLAAAAGHYRHGARLFGAAKALRARGDVAVAPWHSALHEADTDLIRRSLPAREVASAFAEGEALSLEEAVTEASKGPRQTRAANGWPSLTKREQQVVRLVADGLTNPEIAERLVISLTTVKTHVSHIFSKLGMRGRRELAREIRSRDARPR
jgi:predicted ATPase/DNA-binding CsgD family transcriptional regulator/uncharacterized protein HemY